MKSASEAHSTTAASISIESIVIVCASLASSRIRVFLQDLNTPPYARLNRLLLASASIKLTIPL
jgi:hypothetical protein